MAEFCDRINFGRLTHTTKVCMLQNVANQTTFNPTMSKRINIVLPDATISVLDRVATRGTRSQFISKAVLHFIEARGKQSLREQLKTGYSVNGRRDLEIAAEWFPLEEEAAQRFEAPVRSKKSIKSRRK